MDTGHNDNQAVKRGLVRQLLVIMDASSSSAEKDMHPSRWNVMLSAMNEFIPMFFEQNPISQLGVLLTQDGIGLLPTLAAERADRENNFPDFQALNFSTANGCYHSASDCLSALKLMDLGNLDLKGEPSLQNGLSMAYRMFTRMPSSQEVTSREILILYTSLTTCDPVSLSEMMTTGIVNDLKNDSIRVSILSMSAEMYICKQICKETQGRYAVALDSDHFKALLKNFLAPFPLLGTKNTARLFKLGFPNFVSNASVCICHCKPLPFQSGYQCSICDSIVCNIPTECPLCSIILISPIHLIQSYHHLFPLKAFSRLQIESNLPAPIACFACQEPILYQAGGSLAYKCQDCTQLFCQPCSDLLHESLYSCPGCLDLP